MEKDKEKLDKFAKLFLKGIKPKDLSPEFHEEFRRKVEAGVKPQYGPGFSLSPSFVMAAGAGLILVVALLIVFGFKFKDQPHVNVIQGSVEVIQTEEMEKTLRVSDTLRQGDKIVTGSRDWLILELENGYRVKVQPNSELLIKKLKSQFFGGNTVFHLSKGDALIHIGDKPGQTYPVEVHTPHMFAKALGTQFAVSASTMHGSQGWVGTLKGKVEVGQLEQGHKMLTTVVAVATGQEVYAKKDKAFAPQKISQRKLLSLEESFQILKRNQLILLISGSSNRVHELLVPCPVYIRVDAKNENLQGVKASVAQIGSAMKHQDHFKHLKAVREFEILIKNQEELSQVSGLLFAGAYYARIQQFADAVRVFQEITFLHPDSSYASLAHLAAAILYDQHLTDKEKAMQHLNVILQDHPDSLEAPEAKQYRDELLKELTPLLENI